MPYSALRKISSDLLLATVGLVFFTTSGCASGPKSEDSQIGGGYSEYNESVFKQGNRAPASMSPPSELAESPGGAQSQADYHFTMGEALSFDGKHQKAIEAFKAVVSYDPDSARVPLRISAEYIKLGMMSEALEYCELAAKKDPKLVDARLLLGGLYSAMKTYDKALTEYQAVLKLEPEHPEAPLYIGAIYAEQNQSEKAAQYFTVLAKNPAYPQPHVAQYYLGRIRSEQKGKKYEKAAEQAFKQALKISPRHLDSLIALGQLYVTQSRETKFLELYRNYISENGTDPRLSEILAQYHLENENFGEAERELIVLETSLEDNLSVKVRLAMVLIEQKKFEEALVKLHQVLKAAPESDKIRFYLAAVYEESGKWDEAIHHFKNVPKESQFYGESVVHAAHLLRQQKKTSEALSVVESGIKHRDDLPQMYSLYASLLDEQQDYSKAKEVLLSAAKKFPESVQIQFFLGTLFDRTGDKPKVIGHMKKVIEMDPNHVQGLNYLAFTYAEQGENLAEAEVLVKRALKFDPEDAYILDTYGWIQFKQGRLREALKTLEKASAKLPKEAVIVEHLGDVYFRLSLVEKARSMYERALSLEVDRDKLNQLKEKILNLDDPKLTSETRRQPASRPNTNAP